MPQEDQCSDNSNLAPQLLAKLKVLEECLVRLNSSSNLPQSLEVVNQVLELKILNSKHHCLVVRELLLHNLCSGRINQQEDHYLVAVNLDREWAWEHQGRTLASPSQLLSLLHQVVHFLAVEKIYSVSQRLQALSFQVLPLLSQLVADLSLVVLQLLRQHKARQIYLELSLSAKQPLLLYLAVVLLPLHLAGPLSLVAQLLNSQH